MTLPLQVRFDRHKPYSAGAFAKVIKPNCANRSAVQPQKQRVIRRAVLICMTLIVVCETSWFPEDSAADGVIFLPIALGSHFDQFVTQ